MFGIDSSIIIEETIRNIVLKEREQTDTDRWKMKVSRKEYLKYER